MCPNSVRSLFLRLSVACGLTSTGLHACGITSSDSDTIGPVIDMLRELGQIHVIVVENAEHPQRPDTMMFASNITVDSVDSRFKFHGTAIKK
jgi:hypothetical protein